MFTISEKTSLLEVEEFLRDYSSREMTDLGCSYCEKPVHRIKHYIQQQLADYHNPNGSRKTLLMFCNRKCAAVYHQEKRGHGTSEVSCHVCGKPFIRSNGQLSDRVFCSRSCSATYNNQNKRHGTRRSKLEAWLESQLIEIYPSLEIHFNRKDTINSELDIYIPSLSLAIELNGIFHYEPIYGEEKLKSIQNNDDRKYQACLSLGIELCIIDSSQLTYFKPKNAKKYLDIITSLVDKKLS